MQKYRRAVFIVVYRRLDEKILYFILKRKLHWKGWEFPKGGIEGNEREIEAVKREAKEESGLRIIGIKKFNFYGKYRYKQKVPSRDGIIGQTYSLYSCETAPGKAKIDKKEHSQYKWMDFESAVKKLRWNNQKKCLSIVNKWLVKKD